MEGDSQLEIVRNKVMEKDRERLEGKNVQHPNLLFRTLTEWLRDTGGQGEQGADV